MLHVLMLTHCKSYGEIDHNESLRGMMVNDEHPIEPEG